MGRVYSSQSAMAITPPYFLTQSFPSQYQHLISQFLDLLGSHLSMLVNQILALYVLNRSSAWNVQAERAFFLPVRPICTIPIPHLHPGNVFKNKRLGGFLEKVLSCFISSRRKMVSSSCYLLNAQSMPGWNFNRLNPKVLVFPLYSWLNKHIRIQN